MAMADAAVPDVEKGLWVQVWAQVVKQEGVHPEDFVLKVESHNEDYKVHIRRSHITLPDEQPSWVLPCSRLTIIEGPTAKRDYDLYARCQRNADHDGKHRAGSIEWGESATTGLAGYLEDA